MIHSFSILILQPGRDNSASHIIPSPLGDRLGQAVLVRKFIEVHMHFFTAIRALEQIQRGKELLETKFILPYQQPNGNYKIVFFSALAVTAETRYQRGVSLYPS